MHREQGQTAVRRIQGLLSFQKKYGAARVDQACAMALEMEISDFRFVRRYLERDGHVVAAGPWQARSHSALVHRRFPDAAHAAAASVSET